MPNKKETNVQGDKPGEWGENPDWVCDLKKQIV